MPEASEEELMNLTQQRLEPQALLHVNARDLATCKKFSSITTEAFHNSLKKIFENTSDRLQPMQY